MKYTLNSLSRLLALAALMLLAGCLSDEVALDTSAVDNPPPSGNSAPLISGNPPPAIRVGEAYSFTPSASDPDGDSLSFSIQNKPGWAAFDSGTGRVTGTPTLADVGSYSNIQVAVSDGELTSTMTGFSINVTQVATSSTSLSWSAPTLNDDGTALTDLSGYVLYFGTSSRNYSNEIRIDNPSVTTYLVENLSPNTYYFAATAFNAAGVESRLSGELVRSVN